MSQIPRALAAMVSVCLLGLTGGCSQLVTQLFPSRPLEPIVVAHTSNGYELISVCGSPITSAAVQQPAEVDPVVTYSWKAEVVGTPTPRLVLFAERIDGYRIHVDGVRDSATEVVMAADTVDDIEAGIVVDLASVAIGQVAYQNGIVSSAEFEQLPKTAFGCRA